MTVYPKNMLRHTSIALLVFCVGFLLSYGPARDIPKRLSDKVMVDAKGRLFHHISNLASSAKHYFLLLAEGYSKISDTEPLSFPVLSTILAGSIFNMIFQPVFLCIFTPQAILNIVLLPFFLYGSVRYFKKVWPLLIIFALLSFWIGIYDSTVEALIRHGMPCELLYVMIGAGGFTGWIAKN